MDRGTDSRGLRARPVERVNGPTAALSYGGGVPAAGTPSEEGPVSPPPATAGHSHRTRPTGPGRPGPVPGARRPADRHLPHPSEDRPSTSGRTASTPPSRSRTPSRRSRRSSTRARPAASAFSEWTPEQIRAAIDVAGPDLFVSSQPQYSMLWQAPEGEVFGLCAAHGISRIVWSPLAQGVLTGKYEPGRPVPEGIRFASADMAVSQDLVCSDATPKAVQHRVPIADEPE
ncbi:aldo/keto reductase [Streptomyces sp. NPDC004783]|uniref:aldo/keto reductase n=1 Tax=Streptomyces sp. NPDC004783 TaxID=3154459 RepID=UPI0033B3BC84